MPASQGPLQPCAFLTKLLENVLQEDEAANQDRCSRSAARDQALGATTPGQLRDTSREEKSGLDRLSETLNHLTYLSIWKSWHLYIF